jgi:hypothetical protein
MDECEHINITVWDNERVGYCTCADCGELMHVAEALRNLFSAMRKRIEKMDAILKERD